MIGRNRAVIDGRVGHVHDQARSIELCLGKTFPTQPSEIARSKHGNVSVQLTGHNDRLPLTHHLRCGVRPNGDDVGLFGQLGNLCWGQTGDDVIILPRGPLFDGRREL